MFSRRKKLKLFLTLKRKAMYLLRKTILLNKFHLLLGLMQSKNSSKRLDIIYWKKRATLSIEIQKISTNVLTKRRKRR